MVEIYSMTQGHCYRNETLSLAANCSWKAGPYLAEKMKKSERRNWFIRKIWLCETGRF